MECAGERRGIKERTVVVARKESTADNPDMRLVELHGRVHELQEWKSCGTGAVRCLIS